MSEATSEVRQAPETAVFGIGRVGRALVRAMVQHGVPVVAAGLRESSRRLGWLTRRNVPQHRGAAAFYWALERPTLVLLCVPDHALRTVAHEFSRFPGIEKHRFAHTSGVFAADVLEDLAKTGAGTGAIHPLQSFPPYRIKDDRVAGAYCAIDGEERLRRELIKLAKQIGMKPFNLPPSMRATYHSAAVLASNALVTLLDTAVGILKTSGMDGALADDALLPLVRGTLANVEAVGTERALTGPVVRGDVETIARHLDALQGARKRLYAETMRATLDLALRAGRIEGEPATRLLQLLDAARRESKQE